MTQPTARPRATADNEELELARYLEANPDFFERHPQALQKLRLADVRGGGATVSLIERQVEMLREKLAKTERRLGELTDNARANDALVQKIHRLTQKLLTATDRAAVVNAVESSLREDFGAATSVLVLFDARDVAESRFVRVVPRDDAQVRSFDSLLAAGKPRCGQVRDTQRDFLFGNGTIEIGSVALVPLAGHGLLACGSPDAQRFNPSMSTDFLSRIGELITSALARG